MKPLVRLCFIELKIDDNNCINKIKMNEYIEW